MKPKTKRLLIINAILFLIFLILFCMGTLLNYIAVDSNGDKMPAYSPYPTFWDDTTHFTFSDTKEINYSYLADIFCFNIPNNRVQCFSAGDFMLYSSLPIFATFAIFTSSSFVYFALNWIFRKEPNNPNNKFNKVGNS